MKVGELLQLLKYMPDDAEVMIPNDYATGYKSAVCVGASQLNKLGIVRVQSTNDLLNDIRLVTAVYLSTEMR